MSEVSCRYFPACRGCDYWDQSYETQKQNKLRYLRDLLKVPNEVLSNSDFISVQPFGLRHRFDFTIEAHDSEHRMGLYGAEKKLIDIQECLQLSPDLQKVFSAFRKIVMKTPRGLIQKASVRLRIGPDGKKGCWLDMANVDIKALLDDSTYLSELLDAGFEVEMGQKGKRLARVQGVLKLTDPLPQIWFRSSDFLLKNLISDFTQPSWFTGDALVKVLQDWTHNLQIKNAIEFGPGIGQFTLPLLTQGINVWAFENNPKAVEVLQLNARENHLEKKLRISSGDFQNKKAILSQNEMFELALVNPPRSGLKNFVDTVIGAQARYCIYISCFPESMQTDLDKLQDAGYEIKFIKIVDQFPQTEHFESCVLLEKQDLL